MTMSNDNKSTGDQLGGQSSHSESEQDGSAEGLPSHDGKPEHSERIIEGEIEELEDRTENTEGSDLPEDVPDDPRIDVQI